MVELINPNEQQDLPPGFHVSAGPEVHANWQKIGTLVTHDTTRREPSPLAMAGLDLMIKAREQALGLLDFANSGADNRLRIIVSLEALDKAIQSHGNIASGALASAMGQIIRGEEDEGLSHVVRAALFAEPDSAEAKHLFALTNKSNALETDIYDAAAIAAEAVLNHITEIFAPIIGQALQEFRDARLLCTRLSLTKAEFPILFGKNISISFVSGTAGGAEALHIHERNTGLHISCSEASGLAQQAGTILVSPQNVVPAGYFPHAGMQKEPYYTPTLAAKPYAAKPFTTLSFTGFGLQATGIKLMARFGERIKNDPEIAAIVNRYLSKPGTPHAADTGQSLNTPPDISERPFANTARIVMRCAF